MVVRKQVFGIEGTVAGVGCQTFAFAHNIFILFSIHELPLVGSFGCGLGVYFLLLNQPINCQRSSFLARCPAKVGISIVNITSNLVYALIVVPFLLDRECKARRGKSPL